MTHDLGTDLDELVAQCGQGPVLDLLWQCQCQLRAKSPRQPRPPPTSGPGGNPEVSRSIPEIRDLMSGIWGKLTVVATWPEQPLVAISGPSALAARERTSAVIPSGEYDSLI